MYGRDRLSVELSYLHNLRQLHKLFSRTTSVSSILPGIFLYLVTAAAGVWISYHPYQAWLRFVLLAGTVTAILLIAGSGQGVRIYFWRVLGLFSSVVGSGLAIVFLFFLKLAGSQSFHFPVSSGISINADTIDGLLPGLFPLALLGFRDAWIDRRSWLERIGSTFALVLMLGAVVYSSSRSPKLSLVIGIGVFAYLQLRPRIPRFWQIVSDWFVYALAPVVVAASFLNLLFSFSPKLPFIGSLLAERIPVWRNMALLVQDYFLTGIGLTGTEMVYSTYMQLVHVPFLYHAYNLYLQIAIEQGILGLIGFLLLAGWALWYSGPWGKQNWEFRSAAVHAAVVTMLIYGLFDSEAYVSVFMPFLFLPLGAALALGKSEGHISRTLSKFQFIVICIFFVSGFLTAIFSTTVRAQWYANLGSITQTRLELSMYRWPTIPIQDEVRVYRQSELREPIRYFEEALRLDPRNPVANRRLGQMELSLGMYEPAFRHLNAAYQVSPQHRATQQLLGEVYAIQGKSNEAVALWRNLKNLNPDQLMIRHWWYQHIGEFTMAERILAAKEALVYQSNGGSSHATSNSGK